MIVANYPFPLAGGLEKQAHELSKMLIRNNIKVCVLSYLFSSSQKKYELVNNVPVFRLTSPSNKYAKFIVLPFKVIYFMLLNRKSFNVVHLHTLSYFSLFSLLIAKLLKKNVVLKLANVGEYGLPSISNSCMGWKIKLVKLSDALIAMSYESKKECDYINYPMASIFMAPNGINIEDNILKNYKIKSNLCTVVFVGRLDEQKNIETLLYVWKEIISKSSFSVKLEIWGTGPLENTLKYLSNKLNLSNTVSFKGHVENVHEKVNKADIFVLPSLAEGNSNAILEAMAAGLPIVSTDVGGTLMQVGSEGKRYISDPYNNLELYNNLIMLIENRKLRKDLGLLMNRRVCKYFSIDLISNSYIEMYRCLLSNNKGEIYKLSNKVFG